MGADPSLHCHVVVPRKATYPRPAYTTSPGPVSQVSSAHTPSRRGSGSILGTFYWATWGRCVCVSGFSIAAVIPYVKEMICDYNTCTYHICRLHPVWQVESMGGIIASRW